ncbi:MAG: hydratase, partial [Parasporobacterium sp.]|nr:hydratase [Parasporobacterium sp.]
EIKDFYEIHGRAEAYKELSPDEGAYYDGCVEIDLSTIKPMIALPFHPSCAVSIEDFKANMEDLLAETEKRAKVSFGTEDFTLRDKIRNGQFYVEQGIIAGCAGGGFENICAAADILRGGNIGSDEFTLSVYPSSMPVYMELIKNGRAADLMAAGAVLKTAFCGPCFGAGDTPSNGAFSIRHSTRNFPNREGSKPGAGQIASVALMDARSIAATAANKGYLTAATELDTDYNIPKYFFDKSIYDTRVYDSKGVADPAQEIKQGPNIKDWPKMSALADNLLIKVVSVITDPVTTTDELIPSGETSSYRSNPLGLAEFTLSRKDPLYVGEAKQVRALEEARAAGNVEPEAEKALKLAGFNAENTGMGSTIFAVKPGDGSAREQAASCQKVLGGAANIAREYATKRYRSNLINWGMVPFLYDGEDLPFEKGQWVAVPGIRDAIAAGETSFKALLVDPVAETTKEIRLKMDPLTADEKEIILKGCLINYYRD